MPRIDLQSARTLVANERLWPRIVERCFRQAQGRLPIHAFPAEDGSRLALLDDETLEAVAKWLEAIARADELRSAPDCPEALRYAPYFTKWRLPKADGKVLLATALRGAPRGLISVDPLPDATVPLAAVMKLLKLKFPEAYALCCS